MMPVMPALLPLLIIVLFATCDGFGTIAEYIGRGMLCNVNRNTR